MSSWALGTAWALSVLSLLLALPVEYEGALLSRTLLAALPWIALAGVPALRSRKSWWSFYAGMLPLLAVGIGMDHAAGEGMLRLVRVTFLSVVVSGVLALAASRLRSSLLHACVWTALVPLPIAWMILPVAFSGEHPLLIATPIGWAVGELVAESTQVVAAWPYQRDLGLLISTACLFAFALRVRRSEGLG